ncbi:TPA: MinD/ParA family protein, partial [Vibrio parahaemolyticus]|nr:MinD/ParA family protein [Vibrio parahaemolyticus]
MTENMIHDQASGLRRLTQPSLTKVIAVTGGKGG